VAVPKDEAKAFRPRQYEAPRPTSREITKPAAASQPMAVRRSGAIEEVNAASTDEFTWRGFAFGCAIGGAAAAVLLLFIRIAFA